VTLKAQLVMFHCKETYLYNMLCVLVRFTFLTVSKLGGCCVWNHITLSYFKII